MICLQNPYKCSGKAKTYPSDIVKEGRKKLQAKIEDLAYELDLTKRMHNELNTTFYDFVKTEKESKFCNQESLTTISGERKLTSGKRLLFSKVPKRCNFII